LGPAEANAQVTVLHSFGDGSVPKDGADPAGGLIQAPDGNFYGGTLSNVSTDGATVFQMTPAGVVTSIRLFEKGMFIAEALVYDNGKLIGITYGSAPGNARLFGLTQSAKGSWSKSIWYKYSRLSSGPRAPCGPLVLATNGDLYDATSDGGSKDGTIYKVNPKTHQLTVIANFKASNPGSAPGTGLLQASDGNFYGGTYALSNPGEIFKVTPSGKVSTFYTFSAVTVGLDWPLIEGSDGNFYGTASNFVFKMTSNATLTILYTLAETDGYPLAGSVARGPNGNLYGLCTYGGTAGFGTIYEVSPDGSSFAILHNFGDGSVPNDGEYPLGRLLLGADNNFYGVTQGGGSAGSGTIFKVSP
jgi:uncharacterized repeat protein (TIGR03803 family)